MSITLIIGQLIDNTRYRRAVHHIDDRSVREQGVVEGDDVAYL